jgi:hypothetical protein
VRKRDGRPGRAWTKKGSKLPAHQAPTLTDLEVCRAAWASGNPEALRTGIALCAIAGGLPPWLADALTTLLKQPAVDQRLWKPYEQDLIDFSRFAAVRTFRRRGLTWEAAFTAAAKDLEGTPAAGGDEAMAASYKAVRLLAAESPARYALRPLAAEE